MSTSSQQSAAFTPVSRHRYIRLKMGALIGGLILLLVLASLAWWMFSPLFFHTTSHNANPFMQASSTASQPGAVILATGSFIDHLNSGVGLANDHGAGYVIIGKTAKGAYLIHFERLNVTNGPDLHVYLAPTSNSTDAGQVKQEGVDLGQLTATEGSLNVTIPTHLAPKLKEYHSVVIVCKTFSVIFTTAPMTFSSESGRAFGMAGRG
ncbi:MAG TPA: DM13 domain-containing protein [Ktedonosporobacter sp.]|nr:DM13 domain-containing protein [Ktedonosporobacter sp.]